MFELGYSVVLKDLMLETSSVRNILWQMPDLNQLWCFIDSPQDNGCEGDSTAWYFLF